MVCGFTCLCGALQTDFVVYRNVHNHEYIMLNLKVHNICTVSGMTLGARVRCLILPYTVILFAILGEAINLFFL